jgi:1-pyrroline-5-carboxylate dehydrogenase
VEAGFFDKIKELAERRSLDNLSITPVITWNNQKIQEHVDRLLELPGAHVVCGGRPLDVPHNIPEIYGSYYPTAVFVPLDQILANFELCTTELFGPF